VSTSDTAQDVCVRVDRDEPEALEVWIGGDQRHRISPTTAQPANVAAALGLVLALDLPLDGVLSRLDSLPESEHRQQVARSERGVTVIDNTFSSNPASAASSLELLHRLSHGGHVVVVTPGMVELGRQQYRENQTFAIEADDVATDLVVVGSINKRPLLAGAARGSMEVHLVRTREEAVAWVRKTLRDGDTVLYENDLPDHYP
jgi:UDP-N-acetylmuramoyl-tripeptide--D-alanyl-D-alanine ligase